MLKTTRYSYLWLIIVAISGGKYSIKVKSILIIFVNNQGKQNYGIFNLIYGKLPQSGQWLTNSNPPTPIPPSSPHLTQSTRVYSQRPTPFSTLINTSTFLDLNPLLSNLSLYTYFLYISFELGNWRYCPARVPTQTKRCFPGESL